jgi:hypothetical protein
VEDAHCDFCGFCTLQNLTTSNLTQVLTFAESQPSIETIDCSWCGLVSLSTYDGISLIHLFNPVRAAQLVLQGRETIQIAIAKAGQQTGRVKVLSIILVKTEMKQSRLAYDTSRIDEVTAVKHTQADSLKCKVFIEMIETTFSIL